MTEPPIHLLPLCEAPPPRGISVPSVDSVLSVPSEFSVSSVPGWTAATLPVILDGMGNQGAAKEHFLKRGVLIAVGTVMVIAGVIGLILPILPGWIFLIPGLVILSREFHWARRLLQWAKSFMPKKSVRD